MAIIDILGVPHAYDLTAPTGSPYILVFVHGWLLSRHYWQPLIERLAPDYQCLAYDLRGFGDSQPDSAKSQFHPSYTPATYARDLITLLDKLEIRSAWPIGHSLGGTIALWGSSYLQDVVKGVICVNSGGGIYIKEEFERFRFAGRQFLKIRPRWLCYLRWLDLLFARDSVAHPIELKWGRQRLIDFVSAHPDAALGALLDSTTEEEIHRLPKLVSQMKQPAYFVAGAEDKIMEPKYVRHLASFHSLFKGGDENVTVLSECGHLSMVEQPDAMAREIRRILENARD